MIVIGLGGNLGGEPAVLERFRRAREAIGQLGRVRSAPLYRSAPIGPAQPPYLNSALAVAVDDVQPAELIATLLEIEQLLGRDRTREVRWGPRPIDLDVLVWDRRVIATPVLEVPHPRLAERKFALAPLAALAGDDFDVPGHGRVADLLARVADQDVSEIAASW